ncbi:YadA C-terminal domain-containing protein [Morganella morganii]|uniref:YadA C-terminal domain-containing protein n=1 Tax=Morganella morganii TaxID=582 RepID=UPI0034D5C8F6
MKKSILALIISPLFIHTANAARTDVVPLPLAKEIGAPLFHFSADKAVGDREVGISELEQVTERIGTHLSEAYEYIDDVRKDSETRDTVLEKKITHTHQVATSTQKLVDTFIDDAGKKIVPEHINRILPDAIKSELSPLEERTEFLENKTQAMNAQLDITARKAEHNNTLIGTLPEQINRILPDAIKSELSPLEERTEFLENKTQAMDAQLDITARKAEHNNTLIGTLPGLIKQEVEKKSEAHQNYVNEQIMPLKHALYSNERLLREEQDSAKSAKVVTQALLGATEDLETDVDKLKNKVLAVELQAGFAKQSAYTSEKDIREHKNQLSAQSRDIAQNKKLLESAKLVTSAITDATLALEADVAKMDTRISNASKKAGTALNVANQNTKSIDGQKVKVEKNTLDILKNRQDLRSLEKDLRETNERLDNGLAASAALNGLFQPYGVGKLNITAAVGGYQSTQAVAVGTGYRFNENIAVKTGMAYTGSNDVMYNMAFNLEW